MCSPDLDALFNTLVLALPRDVGKSVLTAEKPVRRGCRNEVLSDTRVTWTWSLWTFGSRAVVTKLLWSELRLEILAAQALATDGERLAGHDAVAAKIGYLFHKTPAFALEVLRPSVSSPPYI